MLSYFGGLSLQVKALLIGMVFIAGFMLGWTVHGWKTDAGQARSLDKQIKTATTLQNASAPIIEKKTADLAETRVVYRTIKEKVYEKNDDRICFDAESLSLWNRAIEGANSHRPQSDGTAGKDDTAERYIATTEQVLINAADNYDICNSNNIKHNALLDKLETLKGKMCACGK
jgi:hypothetical protein